MKHNKTNYIVRDAEKLLMLAALRKAEMAKLSGLSSRTVAKVVKQQGVSKVTCQKYIKVLKEKNVAGAEFDKIEELPLEA